MITKCWTCLHGQADMDDFRRKARSHGTSPTEMCKHQTINGDSYGHQIFWQFQDTYTIATAIVGQSRLLFVFCQYMTVFCLVVHVVLENFHYIKMQNILQNQW